MDWAKVTKCAVVQRVHVSCWFWISQLSSLLGWRGKGPSRLFSTHILKASSVTLWWCVNVHGNMGNWHICEGTINAEGYVQASKIYSICFHLDDVLFLFRDFPTYFGGQWRHILQLQQQGFTVKKGRYQTGLHILQTCLRRNIMKIKNEWLGH